MKAFDFSSDVSKPRAALPFLPEYFTEHVTRGMDWQGSHWVENPVGRATVRFWPILLKNSLSGATRTISGPQRRRSFSHVGGACDPLLHATLELSNKRSDDLSSELSIATHPRKNSG
jgi:hypothetical protein